MKRFLLIFFFAATWVVGAAQTDTINNTPADTHTTIRPVKPPRKPATRRIVTDSLRRADSTSLLVLQSDSLAKDSLIKDSAAISDSVARIPIAPKVQKFTGIDCTYAHFLQNPYLPMDKKPVYQVLQVRVRTEKDELFYLLAGLILFLAFIRLVFSKYFQNIFRLFFQPSFRQKQTREQLMQSNLPSLLLNLFFFVSGGIYIALLVQYYHLLSLSFWWLLLYSTLILVVLYLCKFVFLSFSGWVFNVKEAAETYIFVVYLINKILGVLLIPFILILAFSQNDLIRVSVTISMLLTGLLFLYRYLVSYAPVRKEVKVSPLHFLIYICAFEIVPLLLIYKTLMLYLSRTH